jgi:hypothetical protein
VLTSETTSHVTYSRLMMFKFWEATTKENIQETNMEPRKTGGHSPLFVDGRTFGWTLITNKVETASFFRSFINPLNCEDVHLTSPCHYTNFPIETVGCSGPRQRRGGSTSSRGVPARGREWEPWRCVDLRNRQRLELFLNGAMEK